MKRCRFQRQVVSHVEIHEILKRLFGCRSSVLLCLGVSLKVLTEFFECAFIVRLKSDTTSLVVIRYLGRKNKILQINPTGDRTSRHICIDGIGHIGLTFVQAHIGNAERNTNGLTVMNVG